MKSKEVNLNQIVFIIPIWAIYTSVTTWPKKKQKKRSDILHYVPENI